MSMDATRLKPHTAAVPELVQAPAELQPEPPTSATSEPAQLEPVKASPVDKLDSITLGVLASVRACTTPVKQVTLETTQDAPSTPAAGEGRRSLGVLVGAGVALLGGIAWLALGARGRAITAGSTPLVSAAPPANLQMPAHVPTRANPLSDPKYMGFVVVGG